MRRFLALALIALLGTIQCPSASGEETVTGIPVRPPVAGQIVSLQLIDAHREYQLAKLALHEYRFVTLPEQRRQLDDEIDLTRTELAVLDRRLRDYRPFLEVGDYSPVRTAAESHHLALVAAGQRLRHLQEQRIARLRLTRQQIQLYQLDIMRAAARMALARAELDQPAQSGDADRKTR